MVVLAAPIVCAGCQGRPDQTILSFVTSSDILCTMVCMRTNIVLNDELIREAMHLSKAKTKRALIEDALRTLVRVRTEERRRESYRDRLIAVQNRLSGLTLRDSAVDLIRQDREGR